MPARIPRTVPPLARYGITAAVVAGCVALHTVMFTSAFYPPYLPLFAAIVLSGVLFEGWTGVFATLLGGAIVSYFFVAPVGSFGIESPGDLQEMALFLAIGLFAALALEALHAALRRVRQ